MAWLDPVPGEPDLHTAPGQSCQPREAKGSFHHMRPHPQAGSQPFVWKKRGLLVLTSSSPALPAHLPPCTPLPAFQLLFKASTDQLRLQQGRQDPQPPPPLRFCLPPPPQTRAPGAAQPTQERRPPKGQVLPCFLQSGGSRPWQHISITSSCSATQSCPTLCDPIDCLFHHLLELAQTRVH